MSTSAKIEPKAVIRDVVIIYLLTFIGGLIVGLSGVAYGSSQSVAAIALSNLIASTIGFTISGYLVGGKRWKHLFIVAFLLWILSFINVFLGLGISAIQVLLGILPIIICMGVGGSISYLIKP